MVATNEELEIGINVAWVSSCTYLVFLMQLGFAFLEAGSVRLKNLQSILFKSCVDICTDTFCWWLLGYGFAFGFGGEHQNFLGLHNFATSDFGDNYNDYLTFLFQWAFAGTSATIVAVIIRKYTIIKGCVAERMPIQGYLLYSMFSISWIYPIIVHWIWGGGWLAQMDPPFLDFAGSGVVHMTGGCAGLVGTIIIGVRIDRFSPGKIDDFKPNNVTFCVLGSLLLWFSWYGFNCGSTLQAVGAGSRLIPLVGINTTLAATTGALTCGLVHYLQYSQSKDRFSTSVICNGFLSGLVAVTAGCAFYKPYAGFIVGIIGGLTYYGCSGLLIRLRIDDPLDAIPIHFGGGLCGLICVGWFHEELGIFYNGGGKLLGIQLLGAVCIVGWSILNTIPYLLLLKSFGLLRVTQKTELEGQDNVFCGGSPYSYDNTTIRAMSLLKIAEEQGLVQRMIPDQVEMGKNFIQGLDNKIQGTTNPKYQKVNAADPSS